MGAPTSVSDTFEITATKFLQLSGAIEISGMRSARWRKEVENSETSTGGVTVTDTGKFLFGSIMLGLANFDKRRLIATNKSIATKSGLSSMMFVL